MKKTIRKIVALLSAAALMLTLCACGSDYPVLDRKLDITEFLTACFDGSGLSLELDEASVTVSAVADRMSIDLDKSQEAVEVVRSAVRSASTESDAICGTWTAAVDVSGVLCDCFRSVEGLELESYMGPVIVHADLCFTENGIYFLHFDEKEMNNIRSDVLSAGAKAVKEYMAARSNGAAKLLIRAIDENTLSVLVSYAVDILLDMLRNGAAGYYSLQSDSVIFEKQGKCRYRLDGEQLSLSGGTGDGMICLITSGNYVFKRR